MKERNVYLRSSLAGLGLVLALGSGVAAWGQTDAVVQFANGKAALAKGEFQAALEAFKAATKADPENDEFFQEYTLLRRVMNIREQVKEETDAETWQKMSRALYNYYRQHKIDQEALATARALYEKAASAESAALLADAQLAAGENAAAVALLGGLAGEQRSVQTDVLHGIALARLEKAAEAKTIAAKLELPSDADGALQLDAARLYALVGDAERALGVLKSALEATPPNQLDAVKTEAKESPDLASLAGNPAFASALETKSKIATGCAKDCGKCPSKSKSACSSEQKSDPKKDLPPPCKEHAKQESK
jgi:tetratricopeptide (TPR) repeat protein